MDLIIEMGERFRLLRQSSEKTLKEFADLLETTHPVLSRVERGEQQLSANLMQKLYLKLNVSLDWLLTGQGDMYLGETRHALPANLPTHGSFSDEDIKLLKEIIETVVDLFEKEDLTLPGHRFAELIILLFEDLKKDIINIDNVKERALRLIKIAV